MSEVIYLSLTRKNRGKRGYRELSNIKNDNDGEGIGNCRTDCFFIAFKIFKGLFMVYDSFYLALKLAMILLS